MDLQYISQRASVQYIQYLSIIQQSTVGSQATAPLHYRLPTEQSTLPTLPTPPPLPFHYVSLRSASGNSHGPGDRGQVKLGDPSVQRAGF